MDLISISIPTYNRKKRLRELLLNLCSMTSGSVKIIVIDNASTDGTYEMMQGFSDCKSIIYYRNEENLGHDGNQLRALEEGKKYSRYSFVIGDDDMPYQNFFQDIFNILLKYEPHLIFLNTKDYIGGRLNRYLSDDALETDFEGIIEKSLTMPLGSFVVDNAWLDLSCADKYRGTIHTYLGILGEMLSDMRRSGVEIRAYITVKPYVIWGNKSLDELKIVYDDIVFKGYGAFLALLPEDIQNYAQRVLCTYLLADNPGGRDLRWQGYIEKKTEVGRKISSNVLPSLETLVKKYNVLSNYDGVKFILYGAGDYGRRALKLFESDISKVKCFVDNNNQKQGKLIDGIKVMSTRILENKHLSERIVISIHPMNGGAEIMKGLLDKGFIIGTDFVMIEDFRRELARLVAREYSLELEE